MSQDVLRLVQTLVDGVPDHLLFKSTAQPSNVLLSYAINDPNGQLAITDANSGSNQLVVLSTVVSNNSTAQGRDTISSTTRQFDTRQVRTPSRSISTSSSDSIPQKLNLPRTSKRQQHSLGLCRQRAAAQSTSLISLRSPHHGSPTAGSRLNTSTGLRKKSRLHRLTTTPAICGFDSQ